MEYLILNVVGQDLKPKELPSLLWGANDLFVETQSIHQSARTTLQHKGSEFKSRESSRKGDIQKQNIIKCLFWQSVF